MHLPVAHPIYPGAQLSESLNGCQVAVALQIVANSQIKYFRRRGRRRRVCNNIKDVSDVSAESPLQSFAAVHNKSNASLDSSFCLCPIACCCHILGHFLHCFNTLHLHCQLQREGKYWKMGRWATAVIYSKTAFKGYQMCRVANEEGEEAPPGLLPGFYCLTYSHVPRSLVNYLDKWVIASLAPTQHMGPITPTKTPTALHFVLCVTICC